MAQVKIVCDASYDAKTKITGYAGFIQIKAGNSFSATHTYSGVTAEQKDINQGELTAILAGLLELNRIQGESIAPLDISIHSDSQSSIDEMQKPPSQRDKKSWWTSQAISQLSDMQHWKVSYHHVKAHVSLDVATGIEKLNHYADKSAVAIRKKTVDELLHPKVNKSHVVAVLIPATAVSKEEAIEWKRLAKGLVHTGKNIRLHIDGTMITDHPFTDELKAIAAQRHISPKHFYTEYQRDEHPRRQNLDLSILRYHLNQVQTDIEFAINVEDIKNPSVIASQMIYGPALPENSAIVSKFPGRMEAPTSMIINLLPGELNKNARYGNTVYGWLSTFQKYVDLPTIDKLSDALKYVNLKPKHNVKDRQPIRLSPIAEKIAKIATDQSESRGIVKSEFRDRIEDILNNQPKDMPKSELASQVIDEFIKNGYPSDNLFKQSMERFIMVSSKGRMDVFLNRLMKHAERIQPHSNRMSNTNTILKDEKQYNDTPTNKNDDVSTNNDAPSPFKPR